MKIDRRSFLKRTVALASAPVIESIAGGNAAKAAKPEQASGYRSSSQVSLQGFIVSDAHFGWLSKSQPTPAEQTVAMHTIMDKFPELDVFIDTGDAHHDYAKDVARGDWTDVIQGGCRTTPFFFVVGNHENHNSLTVDDPHYDYDAEFKSNILGSVECQPYYSFDMKGIHFVSLPQVMDQAYISDAEVAWLKLDLDVHRDKTTIILSHNSLKGTTEYFSDIGYRQTSNSEMLLELFKRYPNIIAWMHGHNHTYEVVPVAGTVYVSNGRIGGFDPGTWHEYKNDNYYGGGNLGGIFFEIGPDYVEIRCFSATKNKFFDEMGGYKHLSYKLNRKTSFDASAPFAANYGFGGSTHGQKLHAFHHHTGGTRKLFITGTDSPVINENPDFKVYTQRTAADWQTKHLSGYSFEPNEENSVKNDETWKWLDPGVRIVKRKKATETKAIFAPNATLSQRSYYKCAPGNKYTLISNVFTKQGGQTAKLICRVYEKHFVQVFELEGKIQKLKSGNQQLSWTFEIPALEQIRTIYNDCDVVNEFMLTVGIEFSNILSDVDLHAFKLMLAVAEKASVTLSPVVTVDESAFPFVGALPAGVTHAFDLPAKHPYKSCYAFDVKGNSRVTWIEKHVAPRYQVRNASCSYDNGTLTVGPLRNHFSPREEIVIVPLQQKDLPYVHRIRHVKGVNIKEATAENRVIEFRTADLWSHGNGEIEIVCKERPQQIAGVNSFSFKNDRLVFSVKRNTTYKIIW